MRVLGFPFSTNVARVELALAFKGLQAARVAIDPGDRSRVRGLSGQDLVPVLVDDDDTVVCDSLSILRHLELRHPDPPLFPADASERAQLDVFLDWFDRVWKVAPNAIEADPSRIDELAARMDAHLDLFESLLSGREYLMGDELSAADCAAHPFLRYAAGRDPADDEEFHQILDRHQTVEGRPRLAAWIERVANP